MPRSRRRGLKGLLGQGLLLCSNCLHRQMRWLGKPLLPRDRILTARNTSRGDRLAASLQYRHHTLRWQQRRRFLQAETLSGVRRRCISGPPEKHLKVFQEKFALSFPFNFSLPCRCLLPLAQCLIQPLSGTYSLGLPVTTCTAACDRNRTKSCRRGQWRWRHTQANVSTSRSCSNS